MGEHGFGVVFCWQKCRHCTFPVKKDPKSFCWTFLGAIGFSPPTPPEPYRQGSPGIICIHSFTAETNFSPLSGHSDPRGLFGSALSPSPARRQEPAEQYSQAPSLWAAGERKGTSWIFPVFARYWCSPGGICCVCFGYGLLPRVVLLLGEGMVHSYAIDLWSQFPLTVLIFFLKVHSAKLEKRTPHYNWKQFLQKSFLQEPCRGLQFTC